MPNTTPEWEEKVETILFSRFGATAISVSMNNGKVTDGTIKIRDDGVEEVKALFSQELKLAEQRGREAGFWIGYDKGIDVQIARRYLYTEKLEDIKKEALKLGITL